jgi:hypothetical protein
MPTRIRAATWTGNDYLLRGEFCPPEEIQGAVDRLRDRAGADMALLLVAGPWGLLQSLCFASSGDDRGRELTDLLRRKPQLDPRRLLRPFTGVDAFPGSAARLLRRLGRKIAGFDADSEKLIGSPLEWIAIEIPQQLVGTRLALAAFLRGPHDGDHPHSTMGEVRIVKRDADLLELAVMVNATAQARVHHDAFVIDRVHKALDGSVIVGTQIDLTLAAEKLVELAREVTGSDIAGYYAADFDTRTLHLRAVSPLEHDQFKLPPSVHLDGDQVAAVSVERTRPVLLDPAAGPALAATIEPIADAADVAELATPVPGPLARGPVLGVITLARSGPPGRAPNPFGAYDHALARNVALRLALLRATADLESASEMFTQLLAPTADHANADQGTRTDAPIPDDLMLALPGIVHGLRTIRLLTNSHSATFRAALPSAEATVAHDIALHRIAADPPERLNDDRPVQQVHRPSVNCSAAVLGVARNVPFVAQEENFDALREGTSSEMSVPVVVEGLVVGVVNLESTSEQNYDTRRATIIAFAEHIGLLIASARLALSRELESYALRVITRAHELGRYTEAITAAMDDHGPSDPLRATIGENLDEIEARARGLRSFDDNEEEGRRRQAGPATIPNLVTTAIDKADLVRVDTRIGDLSWSMHEPEGAVHIRESLHHIFANVHAHRTVNREPVRVVVTQAEWGGHIHDIVQVTNPTRDPLDAERACNVYRVPVTGSGGPGADGTPVDVPRFGAYLAGGHARALGGEVHLLPLGDDHARVTLMIPSATSRSNGSED